MMEACVYLFLALCINPVLCTCVPCLIQGGERLPLGLSLGGVCENIISLFHVTVS